MAGWNWVCMHTGRFCCCTMSADHFIRGLFLEQPFEILWFSPRKYLSLLFRIQWMPVYCNFFCHQCIPRENKIYTSCAYVGSSKLINFGLTTKSLRRFFCGWGIILETFIENSLVLSRTSEIIAFDLCNNVQKPTFWLVGHSKWD